MQEKSIEASVTAKADDGVEMKTVETKKFMEKHSMYKITMTL